MKRRSTKALFRVARTLRLPIFIWLRFGLLFARHRSYIPTMPFIFFEGEVLECEPGVRLRDVIHQAGKSPHNGRAKLINCRGFGTCGTCAVEIDGELPPPNMRERARLRVPPHDPESGLRFACQVRVHSDLRVTKHPGFWGQHIEDD